MISDVLRVIRDARKKTLGPFSPSFDVQALLREGLEKFLPEDAHKRVSGKLRVSLTRVYDGKNVIITDFETREELLQVRHFHDYFKCQNESKISRVAFIYFRLFWLVLSYQFFLGLYHLSFEV